MEIRNNGVTSFTMAISRNYETLGYFENLMIDIDPLQEVNAYLIRYTPTEKTQDYPDHQSFIFQGKVSVVPLQFVGSVEDYQKKQLKLAESTCGETAILICTYGERDHVAGEACIEQDAIKNDGRITTVYVENNCDTGGGFNGDGSYDDGSQWWPSNDGIHESGSGSTGTTTPIINEDDDAATALTNILRITDQSKIDWLHSHLSEAQEICDFVNFYGQSQVAKNSANNIISDAIEGNLLSIKPYFRYPTGSNYATAYPKFTEYLKNQMPEVAKMSAITDVIQELTSLTLTQIQEDLQWGKGPTIKIAQLDNYSEGTDVNTTGAFDKNFPNTLLLDIDYINALENSTTLQYQEDGLLVYLGMVTLHEYVHYGDNINGRDYPGEEGEIFELKVYGQNLSSGEAERLILQKYY